MSWNPKPVTVLFTFYSACCLLLAIAGIPANAATANNIADAGPDFTLLKISNPVGGAPGSVPRDLSIPGGTNGSAFPSAPPPVTGIGLSSAIVRIVNTTEDFLSLFFELAAISPAPSAYVPVDEGRSSGYAEVVFRNPGLYPDLSGQKYVKSLIRGDVIRHEVSGPEGGDSMSKHGIHGAIQVDSWTGEKSGDLLAAKVAGGKASDVPVPATLWLMGSALLGLGLFINHRKSPAV